MTNEQVSDSHGMDYLLHEKEWAVYGDKAHSNAAKSQEFKTCGIELLKLQSLLDTRTAHQFP